MKTIKIYDVELNVNFHFEKGMKSNDREQPDDPDILETYEIYHKGEDIRHLLSKKVLREIEEIIIEQES